jgi:hypothetical protein
MLKHLVREKKFLNFNHHHVFLIVNIKYYLKIIIHAKNKNTSTSNKEFFMHI